MGAQLIQRSKTELLLKIASEQALDHKVFVICASDYETMQQKTDEYACLVGHDVLTGKYPPSANPELHRIWNDYPREAQQRHFLEWVADVNNKCILVLDDVDAGGDMDRILNELPLSTRIIVSMRNPGIGEAAKLTRRSNCLALPVPPLETEDAKLLIETLLDSYQFDDSSGQTKKIASALERHPFAICAALAYMSHLRLLQDPAARMNTAETLLHTLKGPDWQSRAWFLETKFTEMNHPSLSILVLFESTLERMMQQTANPIDRHKFPPFLQAIAFLSIPDYLVDFRQFFHAIKMLRRQLVPQQHKIDLVFDRGLNPEVGKLLHEAKQACLIIQEESERMYMPGIWQECIILHKCDALRREYWLKQVLLLCYCHFKENGDSQDLAPFAENCIRIADKLAINVENLLIIPDQKEWLTSGKGGQRGRGKQPV